MTASPIAKVRGEDNGLSIFVREGEGLDRGDGVAVSFDGRGDPVAWNVGGNVDGVLSLSTRRQMRGGGVARETRGVPRRASDTGLHQRLRRAGPMRRAIWVSNVSATGSC